MSKPFFAAVTAAALLCGSLPAVAQDATAETVVATVNGKDITLGHMIVLLEQLPAQYQSLPDNVLFDGILDQLVQQTVLAQTVVAPGRATQLRLENEERSVLAADAMAAALADVVTDEALQAAYDSRYAGAEPETEYNASHILVATEDEAKAIIAELEGGADFAELAKAKSTGPSGPNGGDLGWFGVGMMVPPFEAAVVAMEPGSISAPVQTQFGWHVIKLNETRLKTGPAFEEVRADLEDELRRQAITGVLDSLTAGATIVRPDLSAIDPSVLRDVALVAD